MANNTAGLAASWTDVWLLDGVRTPFADYNGALAAVSPTDLGIKAAREVFARAGVTPQDVGTVITGTMAQASFDAFCLPRHVGLYSGVPIEVPAHMVQRVCGTGIEVLMQAADCSRRTGDIDLALCVGAESMSRNPVASYTIARLPHGRRSSSRISSGRRCSTRPPTSTMGDTAENLARQYQITRPEVDAFAAQSFERAIAAQQVGLPRRRDRPGDERDASSAQGYQPRELKLRGDQGAGHRHPYPPLAARGARRKSARPSAACRPAAIPRPSSMARRPRWSPPPTTSKKRGKPPLARIVAGATVGVPPEIMGIGPVPAIKAVLERAGLKLSDIDRFEINEAFGAQVMACARELGIDEDKLNVNGGAIAIGHPLGATGVRLAITLARELKRARLRYGIASACIGGGQGIALLIENPDATPARKN